MAAGGPRKPGSSGNPRGGRPPARPAAAARPASAPPPPPPPATAGPAASKSGRSTGRFVLLGVLIGGLTVTGTILMGILYSRYRSTDEPGRLVTQNEAPLASSETVSNGTVPEPNGTAADTQDAAAPDAATAISDEPEPPPEQRQPTEPGETESAAEAETTDAAETADADPAEPPDEQPPPPAESSPLRDIRERERLLVLPAQGEDGPANGEIAKVFVASAEQCNLALVGAETVFGDDYEVQLKREDTAGNSSWSCIFTSTSGLTRSEKLAGTFTLSDDSLAFSWAPRLRDTSPGWRLRYCLLEVQAGSESETCILTERIACPNIEIDFTLRTQRVELPITAEALPPLELLQCEYTVEELGEHEIDGGPVFGIGEVATIQVLHPDLGDGAVIEFASAFEIGRRESALVLSSFVNSIKMQRQLDANIMERSPWQRKDLGGTRNKLQRMRNTTDKGLNREKPRKLVEAETFLSDTEQYHEKLLEEKEAAQRRINTKAGSDKLRRVKAELKAFESKRNAAQRVIDKQESTRAALQKNLELISEYETWCDELGYLMDELESGGQIQFRVFFEIEGQEIDVLQSAETADE